MGLQLCYYAKQVGQSRVSVAENVFLNIQMAHGDTAKGQLLLSQATCCLLCIKESSDCLL